MRLIIKFFLLIALGFMAPVSVMAEEGATKPKKKFLLLKRKKKKKESTKTKSTKKKSAKKKKAKKRVKKRVKKKVTKKRSKKSKKKRYTKKQRAAQARAKRIAQQKAAASAKAAKKEAQRVERARIKQEKADALAAKKRRLDPKVSHGEWQYLGGFGHANISAGVNHQSFLSSGGFWRLETGINTAVGDLSLGAAINNYSINALLSANLTLFNTLTFTAKAGPSFRHKGLGVDASNEYYNYGGAISLDLGDRGSYGFSYYIDMIAIAYIKKF
jgi:flagellar biosynthesis GTPase FlhF